MFDTLARPTRNIYEIDSHRTGISYCLIYKPMSFNPLIY